MVRSSPDAVALALERYITGTTEVPEAVEPESVQLQFTAEPMTPNGRVNRNGGAAYPANIARKCPDCNTPVIFQEGCLMCISCGWNKCE